MMFFASSSSSSSISDCVLQAHKRRQPYVNLVNSLHPTQEVCSDENVKTYKESNLKSLYYYSDSSRRISSAM